MKRKNVVLSKQTITFIAKFLCHKILYRTLCCVKKNLTKLLHNEEKKNPSHISTTQFNSNKIIIFILGNFVTIQDLHDLNLSINLE